MHRQVPSIPVHTSSLFICSNKLTVTFPGVSGIRWSVAFNLDAQWHEINVITSISLFFRLSMVIHLADIQVFIILRESLSRASDDTAVSSASRTSVRKAQNAANDLRVTDWAFLSDWHESQKNAFNHETVHRKPCWHGSAKHLEPLIGSVWFSVVKVLSGWRMWIQEAMNYYRNVPCEPGVILSQPPSPSKVWSRDLEIIPFVIELLQTHNTWK